MSAPIQLNHPAPGPFAARQEEFEWMLPFQTKQLLTTAEAGRCIGRGEGFVRALVDAGRLEAFGDSALGERESLRITRRSVVAYLAYLAYLADTARSDPADHADTLRRLALALPLPARVALYRALAKTCAPQRCRARDCPARRFQPLPRRFSGGHKTDFFLQHGTTI